MQWENAVTQKAIEDVATRRTITANTGFTNALETAVDICICMTFIGLCVWPISVHAAHQFSKTFLIWPRHPTTRDLRDGACNFQATNLPPKHAHKVTIYTNLHSYWCMTTHNSHSDTRARTTHHPNETEMTQVSADQIRNCQSSVHIR